MIKGQKARAVHGDLRLRNIYVRQSVVDGAVATAADFMFAGFDSAGHENTAQFPAWLKTEAVDIEGVGPLCSITQDLDRDVLLANLRRACPEVVPTDTTSIRPDASTS